VSKLSNKTSQTKTGCQTGKYDKQSKRANGQTKQTKQTNKRQTKQTNFTPPQQSARFGRQM
jgi:hypothetical protein